MNYTADNRKIAADPGVYPQIRNRQDMEACLCGMEVVEAFGFDQPSRRRALERMLAAAWKGRRFLLVDSAACSSSRKSEMIRHAHQEKELVVMLENEPSGWQTDGALLCLEGMTQEKTEWLMRKLYDADSLVLGVLTEKALPGSE